MKNISLSLTLLLAFFSTIGSAQFRYKAPIAGSKNAPVKIVVYSDYECPYCKKTHKTLHRILREYTKEVSVEFRNYPLSFHKNAYAAAAFAIAANLQGKFFEMDSLMYSNNKNLSTPALLEMAKKAGLNIPKLKRDLDEGGLAFKILRKEIAKAKTRGVQGTPTIFINGQRLPGAVPYKALKDSINSALKQSSASRSL